MTILLWLGAGLAAVTGIVFTMLIVQHFVTHRNALQNLERSMEEKLRSKP